jgi:hypothetical protein
VQRIQKPTTHLAKENQRENSQVSLAKGASMYGTTCDNNTGTQSQCGSCVKGSEGDVKAPKTCSEVSDGLDGVLIGFESVCAWISTYIEGLVSISHGYQSRETYIQVGLELYKVRKHILKGIRDG